MSNSTSTETRTSRAVQRRVEAGNAAICTTCDEQVKFAAKQQRQQVIANVYVDGRWDRVEHFHAECYQAAGAPHGPADEQEPFARRPRAAAAV